MSDTPRYILRNAAIWVDRNSQVGQVKEIELPEFKIKDDSLRNAGLVRPTKVNLGKEAMTTKIKGATLDPKLLKAFGFRIGTKIPIMAVGAMIDEDGAEHQAIATLEGKLFSLKLGAWGAGEKIVEQDYTYETDYCKLEIDNELVLEESLFEDAQMRRLLMI